MLICTVSCSRVERVVFNQPSIRQPKQSLIHPLISSLWRSNPPASPNLLVPPVLQSRIHASKGYGHKSSNLPSLNQSHRRPGDRSPYFSLRSRNLLPCLLSIHLKDDLMYLPGLKIAIGLRCLFERPGRTAKELGDDCQTYTQFAEFREGVD